MSELARLAERALAAAPGGDALALVTAERSLMLRYARSRPTQATAIDDLSVQVAVVRGGHVGTATTNEIGDAGLESCGRAAAAAAELAARDSGEGRYPGFPAGNGQIQPHDGHDPATAALDAATGGAALAAAFDVCSTHGVEAHGTWTVAEVETALGSSAAGGIVEDRVTDAFMKVTAIAPSGRSGYAEATNVAVAHIDAQSLAERAARKAAASGEEARLEPGEYPVVFAPDAVGELVDWYGKMAANGLAYAEDRSLLSEQLGHRVAAARINLSDSPRFGRTLPRAFDAEGVAKAPLPLIQDGVAHGVVHDARSAALAGTASTGHALTPGGDSWGPVPTNLVLSGGGCAGEEELLRPVERGIYVTRLWYTNPVRPKETLLTGVTRDGTFLIEGGELARPLADMRLTDSVVGILDRCEDLTASQTLVSQGEFYGRRFATGVACPALRASAVRFTG